MRRPLCALCLVCLTAQLAAALLPRTAFWLSAAFLLTAGVLCAVFVRRARLPAVFLSLGLAAGMALFGWTLYARQLPAGRFAGQTAALQAEVLETQDSYVDGMTDAVLLVTQCGGRRTSFRVECPCLPQCEAGQHISGTFVLAALAPDTKLQQQADGVFLSAEYVDSFSAQAGEFSLRHAFLAVRLRLSANIRRYLSEDVGGVLAAMTVGDRSHVTLAVQQSYRRAGIPHVLVISGLHVSLVCGLVPLDPQYRRGRRLHAWFGILATLLLMGVAGMTPSVLRSGIAVLLCDIGILLLQHADPLTSLALAGVLLSVPNAYTVCDISFELSFCATAGVLLAGEALRRHRRALPEARQARPRSAARALGEMVWTTLCASLCTMPVLILRGMSISVVSVLTNLATFWGIGPILICGLTAALAGCVPPLYFLLRGAAFAGGVLVRLLSAAAAFFGAFPYAQLHFDSRWPAWVLLGTGAMLLAARRLGVRAAKRYAAAAAVLCAAACAGVLLSRGTVRIALVGSAYAPAAVMTADGEAAVFFRGGDYNAAQIEAYLAERNISRISLLVDLRAAPEKACSLTADTVCTPADGTRGAENTFSFGPVRILAENTGGGVLALVEAQDFTAALCSGTPDEKNPVSADLLLASSASPAQIHAKTILSLSRAYDWLDSTGTSTVYYGQTGAAVWLRPAAGGSRWRITGAEHDRT